jgi:hypothetical protein
MALPLQWEERRERLAMLRVLRYVNRRSSTWFPRKQTSSINPLQVFTCVRLLLCISDCDPVRCARLCPRMLRAASMASKCSPGTTGDALLRRSSAQLQALLHTLAAVASGEAQEGSGGEDGAVALAHTPVVRKGTKRRRFRSRNSVLDNWLADDKVSDSHNTMCRSPWMTLPPVTGGRRRVRRP